MQMTVSQRRDWASSIALLAGLGLGVLGVVFFYGNAVGVSYPLFFGLLTGTALLALRVVRRRLMWRNLWPLAPALFCAVMFAVRADGYLGALNLTASIGLALMALYYAVFRLPLDTVGATEYTAATLDAAFISVFGTPIVVRDGVRHLRQRSPQGRVLVQVVRGLLFSLPVLVVFAWLLASADTVFAEYLRDVLRWLLDWDRLVGRTLLWLAISWGCIGLLGYTLLRPRRLLNGTRVRAASAPTPTTDDDSTPSMPLAEAHNGTDSPGVTYDVGTREELTEDAPVPEVTEPIGFRLGVIEASIVLGSVALLFGAFVVVQAVYLFGGRSVLDLSALSFAQYARRGYFELLTVVVLATIFIKGIDAITVKEGRGQQVFRVLAAVLVLLTGVIMASSVRRMMLYTGEFGWTRLRMWVLTSMPWIAAMLGVLLASLYRVRPHFFSFGLLLAFTGQVITANVLNVDETIARLNLRHYRATGELDTCYLRQLSFDTLPPLATLYSQLPTDDPLHADLERLLSFRLGQYATKYEAEDGSGDTVFAWNYGFADTARRIRQAGVTPMSQAEEIPRFDLESLSQGGRMNRDDQVTLPCTNGQNAITTLPNRGSGLYVGS